MAVTHKQGLWSKARLFILDSKNTIAPVGVDDKGFAPVPHVATMMSHHVGGCDVAITGQEIV